jgi:hypothetical protein
MHVCRKKSHAANMNFEWKKVGEENKTKALYDALLKSSNTFAPSLFISLSVLSVSPVHERIGALWQRFNAHRHGAVCFWVRHVVQEVLLELGRGKIRELGRGGGKSGKEQR